MTQALVVDDEIDVQYLFKQYFRREIRRGEVGFHFAFSGEEALNLLDDAAVNVVLVLSDINMPGMTGLELLRQIKQRFPELKVVLVTAYGDAQKRSQALTFGADGYLTKPLDFEELKAIIRTLTHP